MPITWHDVRQWRSAALDAGEADLRRARDSLVSYADDLELMGTPQGWTGGSAVSARSALRGIVDDMELLTAQVSAGRRALAEDADAVQGVEAAVRGADAFAGHHRLQVDADGSVHDLQPRVVCYADPDDEARMLAERRALVGECAARVEAVLRKARDTDADLGQVMARIASGGRHRCRAGGLLRLTGHQRLRPVGAAGLLGGKLLCGGEVGRRG